MSSTRRIDAFWAGFFGTPIEALDEPGARVVPHVGLGDYSGVWFFVRGASCLVSAPAHWVEPLREALAERTFDAVLSEEGLTIVFGEAFAGTVGPAFHGHLDPARFRPHPAPEVRAIRASDASAIEILRAACRAEDWEAASLKLESPGASGWFQDDSLLAAASLTDWGPDTVGPDVLTHPERRRAGSGKAVVSAVVSHALEAGKVLTYQTLMENQPALGIARSLGFEQYASHVAVRLGPQGSTMRGSRSAMPPRRTTSAT
jgi:GNAT superfamily N-acetyltransferase